MKDQAAGITKFLNGQLAEEEAGTRALHQAVFDELHRLAAQLLANERAHHTLQPTALVNEAWLRLRSRHRWNDRTHFLAAAARVMRHVLVDSGRRYRSPKRSRHLAVPLEAGAPLAAVADLEVSYIDLDRALTRLSELDERQSQIVELKFFGGLTDDEVAGLLGLSRRTVKRDWHLAKIWLKREMSAA